MDIFALVIGILMAVVTVLVFRERVTLEKYQDTDNEAGQIYGYSMPFLLLDAMAASVWLVAAFMPGTVAVLHLLVLIGGTVFTAILGALSCVVVNGGNRVRARYKAQKVAANN